MRFMRFLFQKWNWQETSRKVATKFLLSTENIKNICEFRPWTDHKIIICMVSHSAQNETMQLRPLKNSALPFPTFISRKMFDKYLFLKKGNILVLLKYNHYGFAFDSKRNCTYATWNDKIGTSHIFATAFSYVCHKNDIRPLTTKYTTTLRCCSL